MTWFHMHRMKPVDVSHVKFTHGGGQATLILLRCRCGRHDTETIVGHWPTARFLPSEEAR